MTISATAKKRVVDRIKADVEKINKHYKKSLAAPGVKYDVKGGCAGYVTSRDGHRDIHLNPGFFINDEDEMVDCTTPHELAHWAEYKIYGGWERVGRKRSVHGRRWKDIMRVLGADDSRTHNMDTSHVQRKTKKKYEYQCVGTCGTVYTLSSVRHNKIVRGTASYRCRCGGDLELKKNLGQVSYAEAKAAREKESLDHLLNSDASNRWSSSSDNQDRPTGAETAQAAQAAPAASQDRRPTKKEQAMTIYRDLVEKGHGRDMCIQRFMDVLNMTKAGATTYFYNCSKNS